MIDLRSDTVTQPTTAMREAMARAEVGDDGYGEDPTVVRLEERFADLVGKEAALFVPSGTMGNLVCVMAARPAQSPVVADSRSHLIWAERSGLTRVAGMLPLALDLDGDLEGDSQRLAPLLTAIGSGRGILSIENTQVLHAGQALDERYVSAMAAFATAQGWWAHLDGARLFNAAVRLSVPAATLARPFDSVTVCLSKGLSCPAGSLVAGTRQFIKDARAMRRNLGGSMRQVGVLAAAGLVALGDGSAGMIDRLAVDHETAVALARGLADIPGFTVHRPARPTTNIVVFEIPVKGGGSGEPEPRDQFVAACERQGVRFGTYPGGLLRAVTHSGFAPPDVDVVLGRVRSALRDLPG